MYKLGKVIGVACIIFGIIAMVDGIRRQSTLSKLKTQGKQVTGKVHQLRSIQGNIQTYIDYPVAEEKRGYRQIFILPQPISKELKVGDEVRVAYLPEQPLHAIAGENGQTIGMAVDNIPVAIAIFIMGILALVFSIRKGRESQRQQRSRAQLAWLEEVQERVKERAEQNTPPEDSKPDTSINHDEPEEPSPYPPISTLNLKTQDPLKFQVAIHNDSLTSQTHINLGGADLDEESLVNCELSIEHEPEEPEDSHILCCRIRLPDRKSNIWQTTSLIHADNFYAAFQDIGENNQFVSKLSEEERSALESTPAFGPFENMDDDRDYFDIAVSGQTIELRSKYLGMSFHLIPDETTAESFWVVVSGLYDSSANLIPDFVCQIPNAECLFVNDARYDEGEEMWLAEESNPLKFGRKSSEH